MFKIVRTLENVAYSEFPAIWESVKQLFWPNTSRRDNNGYKKF